uniref:Small vasohibin-binding protein n=1 Tax=Anas platyrhynchos TaxID=8839 RepID=A0A8B9SX55_ANAPL
MGAVLPGGRAWWWRCRSRPGPPRSPPAHQAALWGPAREGACALREGRGPGGAGRGAAAILARAGPGRQRGRGGRCGPGGGRAAPRGPAKAKQKSAQQELKQRQRAEIYALNRVMTELEQQQFDSFCKQMQAPSE